VLLFTVIALPTLVLSWGPISHFLFTCNALQQGDPSQCIMNPTNEHVLLGCSMPDAFAFSASGFQYLSVCPPVDLGVQLHNLEFAGFMVQNAPLLFRNAKVAVAVRDFMLGFGSHMVADAVGFHASGGYLSRGLNTKKGLINWVTMQPRMQGIDAYIKDSLRLTTGSLPRQLLDADIVDLVSKSTAQYATTHPGFPTFNNTVIFNCTSSWIGMMQRLYQYYDGVMIPKESYQSSMIYFDEKNAQNFPDTVSFFNQNSLCASNAISYWWSQIQSVPPKQAADATLQFIDGLYNQGMCN